MQQNAVSFESHDGAAVIIIAISLSINHNGDVIGIDGPLIKMMSLNPRQLINKGELTQWKLLKLICSCLETGFASKRERQVIPMLELLRHRWFT